MTIINVQRLALRKLQLLEVFSHFERLHQLGWTLPEVDPSGGLVLSELSDTKVLRILRRLGRALPNLATAMLPLSLTNHWQMVGVTQSGKNSAESQLQY